MLTYDHALYRYYNKHKKTATLTPHERPVLRTSYFVQSLTTCYGIPSVPGCSFKRLLAVSISRFPTDFIVLQSLHDESHPCQSPMNFLGTMPSQSLDDLCQCHDHLMSGISQSSKRMMVVTGSGALHFHCAADRDADPEGYTTLTVRWTRSKTRDLRDSM